MQVKPCSASTASMHAWEKNMDMAAPVRLWASTRPEFPAPSGRHTSSHESPASERSQWARSPVPQAEPEEDSEDSDSRRRRRVPAVRSSVPTVHCCEAGSAAQCASASVRLSKPVHCEKAHGDKGGGAAGGATSQWHTTLSGKRQTSAALAGALDQ